VELLDLKSPCYAVQGIEQQGGLVFACAPSSGATENLRQELSCPADTLQQLLVNTELQQKMRGFRGCLRFRPNSLSDGPSPRRLLTLALKFTPHDERRFLVFDRSTRFSRDRKPH
jgi:hypothetical protein